MPRLLILHLRRRRGTPSARLLVHSYSRRSREPVSALDVAVGLVVIFMTLLAPCGYLLSIRRR